MISMSGYEGYITIAAYDQGYLDFLHDEPPPNNTSFMIMHEYGPFDLRTFADSENDGLESFLKAIAVPMGL